jgi:acetolactate synthase-1/2/3 large subunit
MRVPYFAEQAIEFLAEYEQLILIGAPAPVAFFAYPGVKSTLYPDDCLIEEFAGRDDSILDALEDLAKYLGGEGVALLQEYDIPKVTGKGLTPSTIGAVVCKHLTEDSIVVDEAISSGLELYVQTLGAKQHDWMAVTGGSIGYGLPVALGAGIADPACKVVALQADGSAMYTVQALWSMSRENIDVVIVLLNNSSYNILNVELLRTRSGKPNAKTLSMLDLSDPVIDWVKIAEAMKVEAHKVTTVEEFDTKFSLAMGGHGPCLIEVIMSQEIGEAINR